VITALGIDSTQMTDEPAVTNELCRNRIGADEMSLQIAFLPVYVIFAWMMEMELFQRVRFVAHAQIVLQPGRLVFPSGSRSS